MGTFPDKTVKRKVIVMSLGGIYTYNWHGADRTSADYMGKKTKIVMLIRSTPKGYNLLDLETCKCVLKHQIHPYNKMEMKEKDTNAFFLNAKLKIGRIYDLPEEAQIKANEIVSNFCDVSERV